MAPRSFRVGRDAHLVATRTLRYHVPIYRNADSLAGSARNLHNRAYRDEPEELREYRLGEIDLSTADEREDEASETSSDLDEIGSVEEPQG